MGEIMIAVETFDSQKHYALVSQWWTAQKFGVVPLQHLPQTGVMVLSNGKPAACVWIYKTDSALCWLEWMVANPEIRHEERASVLSVLISTAKLLAKHMGFQAIFTSSKHASLERRIEPHGFIATDRGVTHHGCDLTRRS